MAATVDRNDLEKAVTAETREAEANNARIGSSHPTSRVWRLKRRIEQSIAFETRGIQPVRPEDRTDKRYINIFTFWVAMTFSILPIVYGMLGPLAYGLSLRDSSLIILFFSMLCGLPCAYLATLGPKTGLRQMSLARYSFGYYPVSIPILLNLATLVGFCVVTDVIGGEVLAAVNPDSVSWTVGIAIVGVIAWFISAMGYKVLHYYERFSWIVALICVVILTGSGGKHLHQQAVLPAPEAATVMSFACLIAGYYLPWAAISSDFSAYISPEASPHRIFLYAYAGLIGPSIVLLILGAAIGGAIPNVPTWSDAYATGSSGEVFAAMLEPLGGFGKFILVLLSLSIVGNLAGTVYAVTLNFQALLPVFTRVPRVVYAVVTTVIMIPVAVKAAESFFDNLENFTGIIGYWAAAWVAVILIEHFYFRRGDAKSYDVAIWADRKALPPGIAALAAGALSMALAIPSMAQVWYVGPIGVRAGDIGFEMAFAVTAVLYFPFRHLEIKFTGHL